MAPALTFVTWADEAPSGGNTYNRELVAALGGLGVEVETVRVPGSWPDPGEHDLAVLGRALEGRPTVLLDGIVGCAAPEVVRHATDAGARVHVLVHMPVDLEQGLAADRLRWRARRQDAALRAASGVLCPSRAAAQQLYARGIAATVAVPGTRPAGVATGSVPPRLLCLGALTPTKDQLTAVGALSGVADLDWRADLVGPGDPDYRARVQEAVDRAGLADRVTVPGPLVGTALDRVWRGTDLLLLPSRVETYGLVVTEALARGVPALVSAGTGAVEALAAGGAAVRPGVAAPPELPGAAVPPGDTHAWAHTLRGWLTDAALRRQWRQAALAAREHLPPWRTTATTVRRALGAWR